jgi:hypothetical protein
MGKKNSTIVTEIIATAPVDAHGNSILTPHNRTWALDLLKRIDARDEQKQVKRKPRKRVKKKAAR